MSITVNNISTSAASVGKLKSVNSVSFKSKSKEQLEQDVFKSECKALSIEDKQKMIKEARVKAAGWSLVGGPLSMLYYALRSKNTIAQKFNLDVEKDKDLIKQIKNEQTMWTLPGACLPFVGALAGYLIVNNMNSKNIEVK